MTKRYPLEKIAEILACFRISEEADRRMRMIVASGVFPVVSPEELEKRHGISPEELEKLVQESESLARRKAETHLPQSFNQIRERTRLSGDETSHYLGLLVSVGIVSHDKEDGLYDITEEGERK